MSGWVLWALAACAFAVGEVMTTSFFLAPFAVGGALAAGVDAAGAGEAVSWLVFVLVSVMTLAIVRPLVRTRLLSSPPTRTGSAALIGKRAMVVERIDNHEGVGCVKIDGEVWSARSLDDEHDIAPGTRVEVIDIKGATALVME